MRAGQVRILMGSTPKLGAGTNVQDRLLALHHLDCPWNRLTWNSRRDVFSDRETRMIR